uniref:Annexin n=1 Tax=Biomphalaria glabrata TaxID=6526 RepID=A0A2C9LVV5_BIOGL
MPGSVKHRPDFKAADAAAKLRSAMAGFGTDEAAIIHILGNHNCQQRIEIAQAYKTAYGKDLLSDIKSELTGDFEEVCLALLTPPRKLDAQQLHKAVSGAGTDETSIVEILVTKTNKEIEEIKAAYKAEYGSNLEDDLCGDTSGYFRRLMISLMAAGREPEAAVDSGRAKKDAQQLFDAGEARWGTDEAELNAILCLRSHSQLRETFKEFAKIAGKSFEDSIKSECSGSLQEGYLAIVDSVMNTPAYFARRLNECFKGLGTNDRDLIRIIVNRCEIDMEEIERAYKAMYGVSLIEAIESECGGDYKKMLIALVKMQD